MTKEFAISQIYPTLAAYDGSTLVGYTESALNTTTRTVQAKLGDFVNVQDFNSIQAAVTYCISSGRSLYFPPGTYAVSAITIAGPINIYGSGMYSTIFTSSSGTDNIFTITATQQVRISGIAFQASVTRTAGSFIEISGAGNFGSRIEECLFSAPWIGVDFQEASDWTLEDCYFANYVHAAVSVQFISYPDSGDSFIFNNTFDAGVSGGIAIAQASSGGLRIIGNKFLRGTYHYLAQMLGTTSILIFSNNSSENASAANFAMNTSGYSLFTNVQVTDNQFTVTSGQVGILLQYPGSYNWLYNVAIGGNVFHLDTGATAMNIGGVFTCSIFPNQILGTSGNYGITFLPTNPANSVICHPQDMNTVATPYSGTVTNVTFSPGRIEKGNISGNTTNLVSAPIYGTNTTAHAFTQAYGKPPSMSASIEYTNGAVSVSFTNITTTGFYWTILGVLNGTGGVSATWTAIG